MKKAWLAVTIAAIVIIVALGGSSAGLYFGLSVTVEDASYERHSDAGTVILDDSSGRVILLDENGKCVRIFTPDTASGQAAGYSAVDITDDAVYIAVYTCYEDSPYLETESLVRYDLKGSETGTVFTFFHSMDDGRTQVPYINDLLVDGEAGEVVLLDALGQELYVYGFDAGSTDLSLSVSDPSVRRLPQALPDAILYEAFYAENDPAILIVRTADNRFAYTEIGDDEPVFTAAETDVSAVSLVSLSLESGDTVTGEEFCTSEGQSFGYTLRNLVTEAVFLLCCLWLCVSIIVPAVRGLAGWGKTGQFRKLKILAIGALVVLACGFITAFYSVKLMERAAEEQDKALQGYTAVFYAAASDELDDCVRDYLETGTLDAEKQMRIERMLEENSRDMAEIGQNVVFTLLALGDDGCVYSLGDSSANSMSGGYVGQAFDAGEISGSRVISFSYNDMWIETRVGVLYIYDGETGETIGALAAQTDSDVLRSGILSDSLMMFIEQLSVIITAGFIVTEAGSWFKSFRENRRLKRAHDPYPELSMMHPLIFVTIMTGSVNSILLAVITNEMAERSGAAAGSILVSLPLAAYSIGYLLGGELRPVLMGKFAPKTVLLICAAVVAAGYAANFYCVLNAELLLFSVSVLVTNTPLGIIMNFAQGMSFHARDDGQRIGMNRSASAAQIAAASVSGMLAGFLADSFGNTSVEILGLIFSVFQFIFVAAVIPKKTHGIAAADQGGRERGLFRKNAKRFLADGPTLGVLLFISLPAEIVYGYKGYLFPLFAAEAGMDKTLISSIIVFCTAAAYFTGPLTNSAEKKLGSGKTLLLVAPMTAAALILFIANRSIIWAVAVLVITILGVKIIQPAVISFWQKRAMFNGADRGFASASATLFRYGGETVRSPIFACCLDSLGMTMTCFYTGVCFLASAGVFGLLMKSGRKSKKQ